MIQQFTPVAWMLLSGGILVAMMMAIAIYLGPKRMNPVKGEPFECGVIPTGDALDTRFLVKFYLVAILFVIFDVETVFLYPWAVQYKVLGLFGLVEMLVFLGILIVGHIWVWKRGALEWI